jgi:hypothetical protein
MARLQQISTRNRLLFALNRDDFDLLQPDLEPVALTTYQLLRHSRAAGRAAVFGAGWRCAAGRG